jgi:hypothetical protein
VSEKNNGGPAWLRAVVRVENTVAGPVNRASNSSQAVDVLVWVWRGSRLARGASRLVRSAAIHAVSLPSRRDVQLLDAKVERLQRALDELTARTDERPAQADRSKARR